MRKNSFILFKFSMSSFLRILTIAALFAGNAAAAQQQNDPPLPSCEPSGSNPANAARATCADHTFAQPPRKPLFPPLKKDFLALSNNSARSQQSTNTQKPDVTIKSVIVNLPKDQVTIWTSPFHIRPHDLYWLAPFAATSGILLGSDTHSMARERSNALAVHRSKQVSNYGLAALIALPAAAYVAGQFNGSSQARETGLLSGEAVVDSLIVNQVLKVILARQRPTLTGGNGGFFKNATDGSFPSAHAMLGWTAASVIAHEYPGWLTQTLVYGAASAVSISRITADRKSVV